MISQPGASVAAIIRCVVPDDTALRLNSEFLWVRDVWQVDNLVHAVHSVIHRHLKDRIVFFDCQSRRFGSFIGRIRLLRLPIHLEAKWMGRSLALRDRLLDRLFRFGRQDYRLAPSPRRRRHLIALLAADPPPMKWSDLRYVFDIKEDCNGKEALQARRDR